MVDIFYMRFRSSQQLYYLAGLLDARGKITAKRIVLRIRSKTIPRYLKREFGGSAYAHHGTKDSKCWGVYQVQGKAAHRFLEAVFPYLILQHKTAKEVLTMQKPSLA
jgi:hypothetical protein